MSVRDNTGNAVVTSKGIVSVGVWVEIEQRIPVRLPLDSDTVAVNNVCQRRGQQLILGAGLYWMHMGFYRGTTYR